MRNLTEQKQDALEQFKLAKQNYLENMTNENWIKYCDAARACKLLGVRI